MGDTVNDSAQKVDSHKHIGEDGVIGLLGDEVTAAILDHIVETGGCTRETTCRGNNTCTSISCHIGNNGYGTFNNS